MGLTVAVLFFNPWLSLDVAINAGLLHAVMVTSWAAGLVVRAHAMSRRRVNQMPTTTANTT